MVDGMVFTLLEDCYSLGFADVSSYFYQLAIQALQTEPNIIGPNRIPTGKSGFNRKSRRSFQVVKRVDTPHKVPVSIWVVRGFYPDTGVPYKMTMWQREDWGTPVIGVKVDLGNFGNDKYEYINTSIIRNYVEEVAEKTLLDEDLSNIKKPVVKPRTYKCMRPRGLSLQKKGKRR